AAGLRVLARVEDARGPDGPRDLRERGSLDQRSEAPARPGPATRRLVREVPALMPGPAHEIVFGALVLCDDVRFENNGKLLLIGVYSDVVQGAKLRVQMRSIGL